MSYLSPVESDAKKVLNDMTVNLIALGLYNKVLASYVKNEQDSELLALIKASAIVAGVEEVKRILLRSEWNLNIF